MSQERRTIASDLVVFAMLIAIGVAGRWGQPLWSFTPTSAVAVFAGFYFSRVAVAALVPLAALAISDLRLPAYDSVLVMLATYAALVLPVWFGRYLRRGQSGHDALRRSLVCGFVPATVFYVVTNFAVWAFQSDYEKSLAGLLQCYVAAVPFYRWMLAGDVFYLVVLFGCWAMAGAIAPARAVSPVVAPNDEPRG